MSRLISKMYFLISLLIFVSCSNKSPKKEKESSSIEKSNQQDTMKVEQAVIVTFKYGIKGLDSLYKLEDRLEQVIEEKQVGDYDGHEIAVDYSDGYLYMYGPSAEKLFDAIKPVLEKTSFMKGAKVKLRFGEPVPGVKETIVDL